ncbi:porin [uncultured Hydrogenophaga sp.]|uniref:porin n=1 Tax=uncultured Hydrogenophaga sp. TaxID=199683 RepID=UPI002586C5D2|nr:porin [uncultured Hydrogenophaga sp.]
MKKTLIALAAVAASSAALAQSSVTLFGIMDVNVRHTSTEIGGAKTSLTEMAQDGTASSRLGFRGVEDLGGGMSASFWLEGALNPDTGTAGGLSFQRRSTVSLSGGFGEVRLGRDYVPTFWNHTVYDPFGTNGLGSSINMWGTVTGGAIATNVRSNNMISYFTPNMGGFQAQLSYGFKEVDTGTSPSDYQGLRLVYAAGPLSVAFATASEGNVGAADSRRSNIGASYDFGFIKPMFNYTTAKEKVTDDKATNLMIGLTAPVGPGLIKASYTRTEAEDATGAEADGNQIALGYEYGLSKRTALYGNVARIKADAGLLNAAEYKRTGFELGIRHAF